MRHPALIQQRKQNDCIIEQAELRGEAGLYVCRNQLPGETWRATVDRIIADKNHPAIYRRALEAVR